MGQHSKDNNNHKDIIHINDIYIYIYISNIYLQQQINTIMTYHILK